MKENGEIAERNELGRVACKLPLPPGTLSTLYKAEDRFLDTYFKTFPGYYDTCDAGILDDQGYIHILARDDDVINVAGHRLSTSALEEVVLKVLFDTVTVFENLRKSLISQHCASGASYVII